MSELRAGSVPARRRGSARSRAARIIALASMAVLATGMVAVAETATVGPALASITCPPPPAPGQVGSLSLC